jgi:hypothetical protein
MGWRQSRATSARGLNFSRYMAFENRFPLDNCVKIPERPAKIAGQPPSKAKNRTNLLILVKTLLISGLMQRSLYVKTVPRWVPHRDHTTIFCDGHVRSRLAYVFAGGQPRPKLKCMPVPVPIRNSFQIRFKPNRSPQSKPNGSHTTGAHAGTIAPATNRAAVPKIRVA